MIRFDKEKLKSLESDYSVYHPTPKQIEIVNDMAENAIKFVDIDFDTMKLIIIRSQIQTQQKLSIFQYAVDDAPSQLRMKYAQIVMEKIRKNLEDMLQNEEDKKDLETSLNKMMKYYVSTYAGRS